MAEHHVVRGARSSGGGAGCVLIEPGIAETRQVLLPVDGVFDWSYFLSNALLSLGIYDDVKRRWRPWA